MVSRAFWRPVFVAEGARRRHAGGVSIDARARRFGLVGLVAIVVIGACTTSDSRGASSSTTDGGTQAGSTTTSTLADRSPPPLVVETDRTEVATGETITITGSGCSAFVTVTFAESPWSPGAFGSTAVAGVEAKPDRSFSASWQVPEAVASAGVISGICSSSESTSNSVPIEISSHHTIDFPSTVRVGEVVSFSGACPFGAAGYMTLSLAFMPPAGGSDPVYLGSRTDDDGNVAASGTITAPPGEYLVRATCSTQRTRPVRAFQPFQVTVEP